MAKIHTSAISTLKEDYNLYVDPEQETFKNYIIGSSQSDPQFFRWLFSENFDNDFDMDLTDEHMNLFNEFLESI